MIQDPASTKMFSVKTWIFRPRNWVLSLGILIGILVNVYKLLNVLLNFLVFELFLGLFELFIGKGIKMRGEELLFLVFWIELFSFLFLLLQMSFLLHSLFPQLLPQSFMWFILLLFLSRLVLLILLFAHLKNMLITNLFDCWQMKETL